jgi:hypothetical protein
MERDSTLLFSWVLATESCTKAEENLVLILTSYFSEDNLILSSHIDLVL